MPADAARRGAVDITDHVAAGAARARAQRGCRTGRDSCGARGDSVGPAQPGRGGGRDRQGSQDAQCRQSAQPTDLRCGSAVDWDM
jgi:hypothetical protein